MGHHQSRAEPHPLHQYWPPGLSLARPPPPSAITSSDPCLSPGSRRWAGPFASPTCPNGVRWPQLSPPSTKLLRRCAGVAGEAFPISLFPLFLEKCNHCCCGGYDLANSLQPTDSSYSELLGCTYLHNHRDSGTFQRTQVCHTHTALYVCKHPHR